MILRFGIKSEAIEEYKNQTGSKYLIRCFDGEIKLGKYVLPSKCDYFTKKIKEAKEKRQSNGPIELTCTKMFPKRLIKVF